MRIEAELDNVHTERLLYLQKQLQKPLTEIVAEMLAKAIDTAIPQEIEPQETEGQRAYRIFEESGLIGCFEDDENLSVDYKKHLWNSPS